MLKRYLLYLLLIVASNSNAQLNYDWVYCTNNNSSGNSKLAIDSQKNTYFTNDGTLTDSIAGIIKISASGQLVFNKIIKSNSIYIYAIDLDSQDNIYIAGFIKGPAVFDPIAPNATISNGSMFIAKYDSSGNFIWVTGLGDDMDYIFGLTINNDKILVVGGVSGSCDFDPGPNSTILSNCGFVAQYDTNSNLIWANRFRKKTAQNNSVAFAVTNDSENNFIVSGTYEGSTDLDFSADTAYTLTTNEGYFVAKYDENGNYLWGKSSIISSGNYLQSITTDTNDDIVFACNIYGPADFNPSGNNGIIANLDYLMVTGKYNKNGNLNWVNSTVKSEYEYLKGLCTDNFGNIYISGFYYGLLDFHPNNGIGEINSISTDIFVTKYDPIGNYVWAKSIGGIGGQVGYDIKSDNIANLYITGTYSTISDFDLGPDSTSSIPYGSSQFVAKYSTELTGIEENIKGNSIKIFPNPANDYVMIDIDKPSTIAIINAIGQTVLTQKLSMDMNRIDTSFLPDGLYYYSLTGKEYLSNGKFIIAN